MTHEQLEALLLYYCDDLDHTKRPAIGEDDVTTTIRLVLADHARLTAALAEKERECFALAADACHAGYGDEYGNHRCREVDEARAETVRVQDELGALLHAAEAERDAARTEAAFLEQYSIELGAHCIVRIAFAARMREALEEYACTGLANCTEPKLKDGSCIHAGIGRCGDVAFRALSERERG